MKKTYAMMLASVLVLSGCQSDTKPTKEEKEEIVEKEEEVQTEEKEEDVVKETAQDYIKNVKAVKTNQELAATEFDHLVKYPLHTEDTQNTYYVNKGDGTIWNIQDDLGICITKDQDGLEYNNSFIYMNEAKYPTFKAFVDDYYNGSVYDYAIENYYSEDGLTVVYAHYDQEDYAHEEYGYYKLTFTNEKTDNGSYIVLNESVRANTYTHLSYEESIQKMTEVLGITLED